MMYSLNAFLMNNLILRESEFHDKRVACPLELLRLTVWFRMSSREEGNPGSPLPKTGCELTAITTFGHPKHRILDYHRPMSTVL
jgi:hypothetical protein